MFVNPSAGDLHLVDSAATRASVIDKAVTRAARRPISTATRGRAGRGGRRRRRVLHQPPLLLPSPTSSTPAPGTAWAVRDLLRQQELHRADGSSRRSVVNFVWETNPRRASTRDTFSVLWQGQIARSTREVHLLHAERQRRAAVGQRPTAHQQLASHTSTENRHHQPRRWPKRTTSGSGTTTTPAAAWRG